MKKTYSVPSGDHWESFTNLREAKRMARGNGSNKIYCYQNCKKIAIYLFNWYQTVNPSVYRQMWRKY